MSANFRQPDSLSAPAQGLVAVTPADGADLAGGPCRALYVGVAGDVTVDDCQGHTAVLLKAAPVGVLPVSVARVRATGTTATNIVALY